MSDAVKVGDVVHWARFPTPHAAVEVLPMTVTTVAGSMLYMTDPDGRRVSMRACDMRAVCIARTRKDALVLLRDARHGALSIATSAAISAHDAAREADCAVEHETRMVKAVERALGDALFPPGC
jgi:hypothetical protein